MVAKKHLYLQEKTVAPAYLHAWGETSTYHGFRF